MNDLDLTWLMKLRVVVARCGEMDLARWWNTNGQLGSMGARMLGRGLPRTQNFAQARCVFAVAAHRCAQVFDPPQCATLWHLTDRIEDEFDARWENWLDKSGEWKCFFERVASIKEPAVAAVLLDLRLVTQVEVDEAMSLKRSVEQNSVLLPHSFLRDRNSVALLALAYSLSSTAELAVPYAHLDAA